MKTFRNALFYLSCFLAGATFQKTLIGDYKPASILACIAILLLIISNIIMNYMYYTKN